jgi:hypothetical protein
MSTLDLDDDGTDDDGTDDDVGVQGRARTPWEIQEIVAVALLAGVAVVGVTSVAAGVIGFPGGGGDYVALIRATAWAGLLTAFVVLCAMALVWWQVEGWTDAFDDLADNGTDSGDSGSIALEVREARRHVRRNRRLAIWAGASLVIVAMASVALVIGYVLEQSPVEPSALPWDEILSAGGQSLATVILAGAGLYGAWLVRRRCDDTLTAPDPNTTATAQD